MSLTTTTRLMPDLAKYIMHIQGDVSCDLCGYRFKNGDLITLSKFNGQRTCGELHHCWKVMGCGVDEDNQGIIIFPDDNPTEKMRAVLKDYTPLRLEHFNLSFIKEAQN